MVIGSVDDIPSSWRELLGEIREVAPDAVIAGGALRDRDNGRPIKDLDVFVQIEGERELRAH